MLLFLAVESDANPSVTYKVAKNQLMVASS